MAESTCLVHHTFSYPSSISNEAKQGDPLTHALGESISFGRFMTESLAWEKWSSFSHKRYVEEAERYAQPGSVAQKKAFFEAHYKRIAAKKKEEALLEQANAANSNPEPQLEGQDCYITTTDDSQIPLTNSQGPVGEQSKGKNIGAEIDSIVNFNGYNSTAELDGQEIGEAKRVNLVTGHEVLVESPMKDESLNKLENVVKQNMGSEMGPGESPLMEKPLLEGFKSSQEASSPASEKKPAFPSSIYSVHPRAPKVPPSPAKFTAFVHPRKDNDATPTTWKSPICSMNRQKSTSRSLHTLIYSTSVKEQDKSTTSIVQKAESSRVAPSRTSKYCKTPLKTPTMAYATGALKNPSATPCSENRRPKTPLHPSPSGSKTTGPKWKILSAVSSKSLSACRNKLQSPCSSAPFSFRTEERAARRKQNLEEKFTAKETQKVQLQSRLKEKAGTEIQKLRQSLCFKSRPLPDFYKERETPKNQIKNVKVSLCMMLPHRAV
ncbi:hypothetical protein U1Q18_038244 [Sarracenia purpurea var. burkii]